MEAPSRSTESPSSNSIQDCSILQFLIQASRLHYLFKEYVYTLIDVMISDRDFLECSIFLVQSFRFLGTAPFRSGHPQQRRAIAQQGAGGRNRTRPKGRNRTQC